MRNKFYSWLLWLTNIFLAFCLFFVFFQNFKCQINLQRTFGYAKFLESRISLGKEYIDQIKIPNMDGEIINLDFASNQKYILFLLSPIDCELCVEEAYKINERFLKTGLKSIWIFTRTNQFELRNFVKNKRIGTSSEIFLDFTGEITREKLNCNTPSLLFTEGRWIRYYIKLNGNPHQVKQIIDEIKILSKI